MRGPLPDVDEDDYLPKPSLLLSIDFDEEMTDEELEELEDLELDASILASLQKTKAASSPEEAALWADVERMLAEDQSEDITGSA